MTIHLILQFTKVKAGRIKIRKRNVWKVRTGRRISLPAILDIKPGQTQNSDLIKIIFLVLVDKRFFIKHLLLTSDQIRIQFSFLEENAQGTVTSSFRSTKELKLSTHNSLISSYMFADVAKNISASRLLPHLTLRKLSILKH